MARPGLLLYFDILPALDKLPHAAVGELLLAALHYAKDGVEPSFDDASLGFAWAFLRPAVDRDGITYETKQLKGTWLVYCKQCKRDDVQPLDFDTWRERTVDGALHTVDVSLPTTTTTPSPSPTTAPTQEQLQPIDGSAAAPPALARDSRNLIFLDDKQYRGLVADLGEQELNRCISYLSEYCSMHNRPYKDWDAAIRKAPERAGAFPPQNQVAKVARISNQPPTAFRKTMIGWILFLRNSKRKRAAGNGIIFRG